MASSSRLKEKPCLLRCTRSLDNATRSALQKGFTCERLALVSLASEAGLPANGTKEELAVWVRSRQSKQWPLDSWTSSHLTTRCSKLVAWCNLLRLVQVRVTVFVVFVASSCEKGLQLFQLDVLNPVAASRSGLVDCWGAERVVRAHPSVKDFMQLLMSARSCLSLIEEQARCQRRVTGSQTSSPRRKLFSRPCCWRYVRVGNGREKQCDISSWSGTVM
eukprot:3305984-Rhodomonas_salina.1